MHGSELARLVVEFEAINPSSLRIAPGISTYPSIHDRQQLRKAWCKGLRILGYSKKINLQDELQGSNAFEMLKHVPRIP